MIKNMQKLYLFPLLVSFLFCSVPFSFAETDPIIDPIIGIPKSTLIELEMAFQILLEQLELEEKEQLRLANTLEKAKSVSRNLEQDLALSNKHLVLLSEQSERLNKKNFREIERLKRNKKFLSIFLGIFAPLAIGTVTYIIVNETIN